MNLEISKQNSLLGHGVGLVHSRAISGSGTLVRMHSFGGTFSLTFPGSTLRQVTTRTWTPVPQVLEHWEEKENRITITMLVTEKEAVLSLVT